jgi:hypothetical protein
VKERKWMCYPSVCARAAGPLEICWKVPVTIEGVTSRDLNDETLDAGKGRVRTRSWGGAWAIWGTPCE